MTTTLFIILAMLSGYLIGSIPNAVWIGKVFFKTDVRTKHSGNAGATNSVRVLGVVPGIIILLLDALKGFLPTYLAGVLAPDNWSINEVALFQGGVALSCIVGHIFPIFAKFKGGKGVATIIGVILALFPVVIIPVAIIFVVTFLIFRYISLASIVAGISFPFFAIFVFHVQAIPLVVLSICIGVFIPITHYKNIKRLIKGEETKFKFKKLT